MILHKTLAAFLLLSLVVAPDEGQWLPTQVRKMDWEKLKKRGMELSKDEFWHPEKGGVLTAAVQINGCSASFVSKQGLVITNHHCGFGAIQALSTVDKNYVQDGFVANSRDEELPARGMQVRIIRKMVDVTKQVHAAMADAETPVQRVRLEQMAIQKLVQEGEREPNTECSVSSFFEGREYVLYYRTLLKDVRLVYAPPRSIGEFGGEVDNWEWPRHTGDFCLFRAYAAPDGSPRGYQEDNVPFQPKHILKVSRKGVQEGDLVLIMGFPGRTERYLTSVAVKERQGISYPLRLDLLTNVVENIQATCEGDAKKTLQYSAVLKSIANVQKNALGMIKGLARNAVVERKLREERQFTDWLKLSEDRQKKWGGVLKELMDLDHAANQSSAKELVLITMLNYPGGRTWPFFASCFNFVHTARVQPRNLARAARMGSRRDFESLQLKSMAMLVEAGRQLQAQQKIEGLDVFEEGPSITAQLQKMIEASPLCSREGRQKLLEGGAESVTKSEDPLIRMFMGLSKEWIKMIMRRRNDAGRRLVVGPKWIEAQQQWRGTSFYPDANSTMRVSIASVKGYEPRDGAWYKPHTTVQGVLDKFTGKEPFDAPKALLTAAKNRKTSRFFDQKIGDVPVCFLSDGDTTGGNSGSPVVNGKGELVGLNFDRAFESVSGDYGWNADRSRNISVDIRYALWIIEQVMPAPHLLEEMGVK